MGKDFGSEQYFEDFAVGDRFEVGPVVFREEEMVAFARLYDPQPFHIDVEAAVESVFGGLIASGWQVLALTFRALIDAGFLRGGGMGSPGIDEVRWLKPVRPGDSLHVSLTVTATRPSASRADRGYVNLDFVAVNQDRQTVMTYSVVEILARRRPPAP